MDFDRIMEEVLQEENSLEKFYKKWVEASEKLSDIFEKGSKNSEIVSEFITRNTEFIQYAKELYIQQCMANG
ncbi:hypothetical protein QUF80_22345 [Desulfococcaceae bacterium HSG8]|nr:hypothetical protein [Desulfococcaceae bacterium HSG8]